jgi:hypothetical protein
MDGWMRGLSVMDDQKEGKTKDIYLSFIRFIISWFVRSEKKESSLSLTRI